MNRQSAVSNLSHAFLHARPLHQALALVLCCALAVQAAVPAPVNSAFDDYDALSAQLNGLVGQRTAALVQLAQADGAAGALVARDALAALVPALGLEVSAARQTLARALSARRPVPLPPAAAADRSIGAGLLLGPHLSASALAPQTAPQPAAPGWNEALLTADGLAFVPASSILPLRPAGAADPQLLHQAGTLPILAPITPTPSVQATPQTADLGDAQDSAPIHALEIDAAPVPVSVVAPQARVTALPLRVAHSVPAPTPVTLRGAVALRGYASASADERAALASIQIPDGLPSAGLDTNARITQLSTLQTTLGHYTLAPPAGGYAVQVNAPGFLAPQVTWAFSETSPLGAADTLILSGNGHADGGSLHDLVLQAATLHGAGAPLAAAPGTRLSFALTPDGAAEVTTVSTITGTTTITTLARIDGVGSDPALESALARERLALAELSGVLSAGNAVYARLQPLYALREQQYTQDLGTVMARNAALEQAWWPQEVAWRAYQNALDAWKQRRAAWLAYLGRQQTTAATPSSATAVPNTFTPVPTNMMAAQALPLGTVAPVASTTPQGAQGAPAAGAQSSGLLAARHSSDGLPRAGVTPIFGLPPVPSPTATAPTAVQTANASTPTSASVSPTPPLGAPSVVITPSDTATPLVLPSPLPIADTTPITGATPLPAVPQPPGPPPSPVPSPGLEPAFEPLPPILPPLPPWVNAPPPALPRSLSTSLSHGLGAFGYANMTVEQLLAAGALDTLSGFIPPVRGVITTYWGGSTPWQSFHPGIDIAAPADTPVRAAAAGIVIYAGLAVPGDPTLSYGNCVMIMHNSHLSTLYGHMEMGAHGLQVAPGQVVSQGQIIGYEGATGWATGPHVHFEMRLDNVQFDPLLLLDQKAITG